MAACLEEKLGPLLTRFLLQPITPEATLEFEQQLQKVTQELGRELMEWTLNAAEPDESEDQPHDVKVELTFRGSRIQFL